jgi:hypothetical protein
MLYVNLASMRILSIYLNNALVLTVLKLLVFDTKVVHQVCRASTAISL